MAAKNRLRQFHLTDIETPIQLYYVLALALGAGLSALVVVSPSLSVQLLAIGGMIVVFVVIVAATRETNPEVEEVFWGDLEPGQVKDYLTDWHCRWCARTDDGGLVNYLDDTVEVTNVDAASGEMEAEATIVYEDKPGQKYKLTGRVSKKGLAHLYYSSPHPYQEKKGMVILQFDFQKDTASGWWLGEGRTNETKKSVGGEVTWWRADRYHEEWEDKPYPTAPGL